MSTRTLSRMLWVGALVLLLSGCFKVNMDVEVSPDNTVSGSAVIAFDQSLLELSGQSVDELFRDMDLSDLPPGATVEPYDEDGFVGQEITFEGVSLEEFRGQEGAVAGTGEPIVIERRGDEFHVTGRFDMSGEEFTGGGQIPSGLLDRFEFRISITFPGEVKSSTGEVDGNTVTWEPRFGEDTRIEAVASAIPSESSPLLTILLIVAGVLIVAAIAFLLMRSRRPVPAAPADGAVATPFEGSAAAPMPTEPPAAPGHPTSAPPDAPGSAPPSDDEAPPPVPPVSG